MRYIWRVFPVLGKESIYERAGKELKFLTVIVRIWHKKMHVVRVINALGKWCLHLPNIAIGTTTTIRISPLNTPMTPGQSTLFFSLHNNEKSRVLISILNIISMPLPWENRSQKLIGDFF